MLSEQDVKAESTLGLNDFEFLANAAYRHHLDKTRVAVYFAAYENQHECDTSHYARYLQLKYFHSEDKWPHLNDLAGLFLKENKKSLALMCLAESLFLNCEQPRIFSLVDSLKKETGPKFHDRLKESKYSVSVIMATYNKGAKIRESIESVLNQTFQDFEVIVINDGGGDDVYDVLQSYQSPKIKYYKLPQNKGLSAALNYGIQIAEGKYVAYLDDDDIYYQDHLDTLLATLKETNSRLAYANTQGVQGEDVNGKFMPERVRFVWDEDFDKNRLASRIYISTCSVMHERDIVKDIGLFNEDLHMSLDWDFWLRCAERFAFKHVKRNTSEYRLRTHNSTNNKVDAYFYGELVCHYYAFFKGDIARLKYQISVGHLKEAKIAYDQICAKFTNAFRTPQVFCEMLSAANMFNDRKLFKRIAEEFFQLYPRECVKNMSANKSVLMFLGILPKIPKKIVKYLWRRIT